MGSIGWAKHILCCNTCCCYASSTEAREPANWSAKQGGRERAKLVNGHYLWCQKDIIEPSANPGPMWYTTLAPGLLTANKICEEGNFSVLIWKKITSVLAIVFLFYQLVDRGSQSKIQVLELATLDPPTMKVLTIIILLCLVCATMAAQPGLCIGSDLLCRLGCLLLTQKLIGYCDAKNNCICETIPVDVSGGSHLIISHFRAYQPVPKGQATYARPTVLSPEAKDRVV
uniref:Uncharacterized protein n=1 Tax=Strigamia maritima TaxID=126957 RepID=T1JFM8_STRMM